MGRLEYVQPSDVRFTQDSIHNRFQDGGSVNGLIEEIQRGDSDVNVIPPIRVCKENNKYYSIDNRRLYVFRVLQKRGHLHSIKVKIVPYIKEDKFTTTNDGVSIRVRRDRTHPHSFDEPERPKPRTARPVSPPIQPYMTDSKPERTSRQPSATANKNTFLVDANDVFARNIASAEPERKLSSRASGHVIEPPLWGQRQRDFVDTLVSAREPIIIGNPPKGKLHTRSQILRDTPKREQPMRKLSLGLSHVSTLSKIQPVVVTNPTVVVMDRSDLDHTDQGPAENEEEERCCPRCCSKICCCCSKCFVM